MIKRIVMIGLIGLCMACGDQPAKPPAPQATATDTAELDGVALMAMAGDYQAQRNLAYGYSTMPYPGQAKDPMRACAWRLVIKASNHRQYDAGDEGNVKVDCGPLAPDALEASINLAGEYLDAIARGTKP